MRALVATGMGTLEFQNTDQPRLTRSDSVILKILSAGICGSDIHIWHGTNPFATYPRILGHEIVGEVVETGANVSTVALGDRVIVNQLRNCGYCYACKIGRPNVCQTLEVLGVHQDGGFREFMEAPENSLIPIPANIAPTDAVMIEPISIAVQGCWRAGLTDQDRLLILGAGALGSSILKVAAHSGATIIVADVSNTKLENAKANGAQYILNTNDPNWMDALKAYTNGYGPTVAIDAACFHGSLPLLTSIIGNAGRIVTMGFSSDPEKIAPVEITGREIEIRGSRLQSNKFPDVIEMIRSGKLHVEGMVSHVFPFRDGIKAMELAASGQSDVLKVVLDMTI